MRYMVLKEVCKITMGQSPDSSNYNENEEGVPFFQGNADFGERYPITRVWCSVPKKIAYPDDILISVRAPIGALNYAREECCIGRGLAALTPDRSKVSLEFLYWLLKGKQAELNSKGTGSTFKAISRKVLEEILIPNIGLDKQKECANVLEKTYGLLHKQKEELQYLDDLIKARFVEMFGSCEWTTTLGNYIAELRGGKSLSGTKECKNKVLKTGAATFGWFDPEQYKYLPKDYKPLSEHRVETGDVMISRMNTPELVGACSYVFEAPENMYYPDRLWKVIPKNQANPIFIWQLLWDQEIRRQIKEKSGGTSGTMHNISKRKLLEIKCIDVPENEQNKFAEFVIQVNKSKVAVQKALDETQLLFDSLMQEYFG